MTLADQDVPVLAWNEPDGLVPRGTVVVIPGRGELPTVYERFGRRLAGDAYRVRVVADPVVDAELARAQISGLLADPSLPAPRVLAGSDTGALFAIMLARSGLGVGRGRTACSWPACPPHRRLARRPPGRRSWTPGPRAQPTAAGSRPRPSAGVRSISPFRPAGPARGSGRAAGACSRYPWQRRPDQPAGAGSRPVRRGCLG